VSPRVIVVDARAPEVEALAAGAEILRGFGLVAFPTETVYGLGARALSGAHVQRIFAAKGRPSSNPLIVHVASLEAAQQVAVLDDAAIQIGTALWPGPVTLVLPRRAVVPDEVTAGGETVAVRIPAHPVALGLLHALGEPIAAPSANRSQELSPTTAAHVVASLGDRVDLVLDAGPTSRGLESTVIDLTGDEAVLLRPGSASRAALREILRAAGRPLRAIGAVAPLAPVARSPGQMDRHYAPRARLLVVPTADIGRTLAREGVGERVRVLSYSTLFSQGVSLPAHPERYGAGLYATLHELDRVADLIIVEAPPEGEAWEAVHDRLARASKPPEIW
jgi:L-threonylcarbamoyladenylate synthase